MSVVTLRLVLLAASGPSSPAPVACSLPAGLARQPRTHNSGRFTTHPAWHPQRIVWRSPSLIMTISTSASTYGRSPYPEPLPPGHEIRRPLAQRQHPQPPLNNGQQNSPAQQRARRKRRGRRSWQASYLNSSSVCRVEKVRKRSEVGKKERELGSRARRRGAEVARNGRRTESKE